MGLTTTPTQEQLQFAAAMARMPEALAIAADRMLVEDHGLRKFIELAWHTVEGGSHYSSNWHIHAITEHLEAVSSGDIKRLIIAVPPRSMKSVSVAVMWPAWDWIKRSDRRFLFSSYAQSLSIRDSARCRRVIQSPWYQARWGHLFRITSDQNTKQRFDNDKTGYRLSTSVGGTLTGEGGSVVVVDDPINSRDADSALKRESMLTWWKEFMSTRLNNPAEGAFVIIQQRLHERDLIGDVIKTHGLVETGGEYVYLCYDNEMEILTEYGWTRFENLQRGVRVMGVDPETLVGTWQEPTGYLSKHYAGPMHHYKSSTCDLMVTPDHRMVFKDFNDWKDPANRRRGWRVRPAAECPRHLVLPQAIEWEAEAQTVQFAGREWDVELLGEFMGWYLAEGSVSKDGYPYSVVLVQKDGDHANEIEACVSRVPFRASRYRRAGDQRIWQFSRKALWQELAPLGGAAEKRIPDAIKALPARALRKLLMAYAKGDGHLAKRNPNKITISSISKRMIDDLQECAVKVGWASSMNYCREKGAGHFPNGQKRVPIDVWKLYLRTPRVEVGEDRKWYARLQAQNISHPHYDGLVHCVSVPTGALVVRRNGRVTISGNCLPAEYEPDHPHRWFRDPRTEPGQLLWPSHVPRDVLETLKKSMGPYSAAGQLQQRPAPREGGIFKLGWFPRTKVLPPDLVYSRGWDLAASEKKTVSSDPDYTATVKIGFSRSQRRWYIVDIRRWRENPAEIERIIKTVSDEDAAMGHDVKIALPKDPGQAGLAQSKSMLVMLAGYDVLAEPQSGDKMTRAMPLASQASGGNVSLLSAEWNDDFLNEITGFPTGAHDDMVDAAATAFTRITGGSTGLIEYYQQQLDAIEAEKKERAKALEATGGVVPALQVIEEDTMDLARALTMTGEPPL